ncbi:MAG: ubiquinone biosynthesis protein UbiH, partial [Sideroxydans sp.]|nr:ubiquinone biosynthesis protein UbiH [Sideroxydans sp.]
MNESQCDVAIIGGGPVGAALALALQGNGLQVVLLEARESEVNTTDPRALALSYGTRLLLQRLGAWEALRDVSAIKVIEVTQKNSTGLTTLRAQEMGVEEMGYVLPYTLLHGALQKGLANSDVKCTYGARVSELRHTN